MMEKKGLHQLNILLWVLFLIVLISSMILLPFSPLPWYDEVDFASISRGFSLYQKFICTANDLYFPDPGKEVLFYGPIFFILNAFVIKVLGFGMLQMRLLNYCCGLICLPLLVKLYKQLSGRPVNGMILAVLYLAILTDYSFYQDMHSGRMELVGLCLMLGGLLLADWRNEYASFAGSGVLISLSLLTTPRLYFISIPYFLYLLYLSWHEKDRRLFFCAVIAVLSCFAVYSCWVFLKFGDYGNFLNYLTTPTQVFGDIGDEFFQVAFPIAWYQVVPMLAALVALGISVINRKRNAMSPVILVSSLVLVLYLLLSGGSNIYYCLISGFIYLILLGSANSSSAVRKLLGGIILFNLALIAYKTMVVVSQLSERNPSRMAKWMNSRIPGGSIVVGDDQYYYAAINNRCEFQYAMRGGELLRRINYQRQVLKADYLMVADTTTDPFQSYRRYAKLRFIDEFNPGRENSKYSPGVSAGYNGYLFQFLR